MVQESFDSCGIIITFGVSAHPMIQFRFFQDLPSHAAAMFGHSWLTRTGVNPWANTILFSGTLGLTSRTLVSVGASENMYLQGLSLLSGVAIWGPSGHTEVEDIAAKKIQK